ncbi:mitochondrial large ribosomal subunit protein [Botrytis cinerea]
MKPQSLQSFTAQFGRLSLASNTIRPLGPILAQATAFSAPSNHTSQSCRSFSSTAVNSGNWLLPTMPEKKRSRKGRPRVPTGGSARGTTLQLKVGEDAIKVRLKGMRYRLYKRVAAQIGVYSSGNEVRQGKGKGSFDHWASRIAVSKIIFELKGDVHEQVARDAFRLAGNKMPGQYEFVKKGDPPVVGITKLDGVTMEELKRPRRKIPLDSIPVGSTAETTPSSVSTSTSPDA